MSILKISSKLFFSVSPPPFTVIPSVPVEKVAISEPKGSLSLPSPVHEKHAAFASHDTQRPATVGHLPDQESTTTFEAAILTTAIAAYSALEFFSDHFQCQQEH